MIKKVLSILLIQIVNTLSLVANAHNMTPQTSGISGQIRLGYVNSEDNTGNNNYTLALGGKLHYNSTRYQGFNVGGTIYTTNAIGSIDDEALFLAADKSSYSILGEAYLDVELGQTSIKLGRQEIETPFADTDNIGMIPNTFESLFMSNKTLTNTTLLLSHLHRQAGVDAAIPEKFRKINGNHGVTILGVLYEPSEQWNLQGWHYNANNGTDISYIEASVNPMKNISLGLQYATQDGAGFGGKVWGISTEYAVSDLTLSAAYNQVSDGQVTNGFGGGPFFTSAEDHTIADAIEQKATAVGIEYEIDKLTLAALQVNFDKGENELDLIASYAFNDQLSADIIYSDLSGDGKLTKVFINYSF